MKRLVVTLIVITYLFNSVALGQKKGATKSPCANMSETQAGANACARYKFEKADAEMNRVYGLLLSQLAGETDKDQQKLRQAQSLWLQYRDANCDSEASIYEGGSIRPAIYSHCLASVTQERTIRMKAFLAEVKM
jgi:uncharacterized protein YecT (DUF1311 family)